jgi:uncharacterized protein involved in type VI secretion and phage assembly
MTVEQVGARPEVAVDGSAVADAIAHSLRRVVVDSDVLGPDCCTITLDDPKRDVLADGAIDLGSAIEVTAGAVGEEIGELVFDGVVYAVGTEFDEHGSFATVVAYDRSHPMYTGVHTKTYQNVTDSDLAEQLAGEVGLSTGHIDATDVVHDHLAQINETHFAFLSRRAREVDRRLVVTGLELNFVRTIDSGDAPNPGDFDSTDPLQLVSGGNLERLVTRMTAAEQVVEVEVRGWDPQNKEAVVATRPAESRAAQMDHQPKDVAGQFNSPRHITVDVPLATQAECDAIAEAEAQRIAGAFVHAEGTARGDPRIMAGAAVSLGNTGGRFDGKVTISRARHTWDRRGYRTWFVASGGHDRSLMGLISGRSTAASAGLIPGVVMGIVTNVADDDEAGRVKLRFPWLSDDYESDWTRVMHLGAGHDRGLVLLPEVNDEVLVAFEHGDSRKPYVIGGLYNGVDTIAVDDPIDTSAGVVNKRGWRSRSGHQFLFTDTDGEEKVEITTKDDTVAITLDAANSVLTIEVDGDAELTMTGDATISAKNFSIEATGKGSIAADGGLELKSSGEVSVSGSKIRLN